MPFAVLTLWFFLAFLAGALGLVSQLIPPQPQLVLISLTFLSLILFHAVPRLRTWLYEVNLHNLMAFHLTRFVGFYFLCLYSAGMLPFEFAVPGGIGDITVAVFALILIKSSSRHSKNTYLVWNTLGIVDILFVVFTATRLALENPVSMQELLLFPLSLLPTFIVPIIIASHLVIFRKLAKGQY